MTQADERSFEDWSDAGSWSDERTREWSARYVHPRRTPSAAREHAPVWLYAAGGTAAVVLGLMASRVLVSLFMTKPIEAPKQILANKQSVAAPLNAAAASTRAAPPAARKVVRNRSSAAPKVSVRGHTRSSELSTTDIPASTGPFDMDLMDVASSPMELRALAESRVRGAEPGSLRNAIIDEQRQRDPMGKLDMIQDPGAPLGTLRINSRPWAQVYIDNKPAGTTPLLAVSIPTGTHSVRLVNQEFSMTKTFDVVVAPGESITRVVSLDD